MQLVKCYKGFLVCFFAKLNIKIIKLIQVFFSELFTVPIIGFAV